MSTKKKRKSSDNGSSGKGKGRKVAQDEPSLKKKKVNDEIQVDDEGASMDTNAMQTRIRTGTISKVIFNYNFYNDYYNCQQLEHTSTVIRRYRSIRL